MLKPTKATVIHTSWQSMSGQLRRYPLIRQTFPLLPTSLQTEVSRLIIALPPSVASEILGHLEAAVKVARSIKMTISGSSDVSFSREVICLQNDSPRTRNVLRRLWDVKGVLQSIHPRLDEIIAFTHDVGKFTVPPPFWAHSDSGYQLLKTYDGRFGFASSNSSISHEDISVLIRFIARFHIAISNFCSGERSWQTFSQLLQQPELKSYLQKKEFARLFLSALLDITISDVGAYGKLALSKIEDYLVVYDCLANYFERGGRFEETISSSQVRINRLLSMEDRAIDTRTEKDPLIYYHAFEARARRRLSEDEFEHLLLHLGAVDKLVYFRGTWAALAWGVSPKNFEFADMHPAAVTFMQQIVAQVHGRPSLAGHYTMVELPKIKERETVVRAINLLRRPSRIDQLFSPELTHLGWDVYTDSFGTSNDRLRIGVPEFLRRCRTIGLPASLDNRALWKAAFAAAGFEVLDTEFSQWPRLSEIGAAKVPSPTACLSVQVAVGSFLSLQKGGAGVVFRAIETDGVHPVCHPERGYAHALAIPAYFPEVSTSRLRQMPLRRFRQSPVGGVLAELGLSKAEEKAFYKTMAEHPSLSTPRPFSPEALCRTNGRRILLIGREKKFHPRQTGNSNLLTWLVEHYEDISVVTPTMYNLKTLGLEPLVLTTPYEWKVESILPIAKHLVETGEIHGIIFCQTDNCRPANACIDFLLKHLIGPMKSKRFPYLIITPTQSETHVKVRLRAFMESLDFDLAWFEKALDPTMGAPTAYYLGVDIGSTTIKVIIIGSDLRVRGLVVNYRKTTSPAKEIMETVSQAMVQANLASEQIVGSVACGTGSAGLIERGMVDRTITEITAHGIGAYRFYRGQMAVLDVGGEDTKVVTVDNQGRIENFVMNTRCGAGTGRSLSRIADNVFHRSIDDLDRLAGIVDSAAKIGGSCAVHFESGVQSSLVALGPEKDEVGEGRVVRGLFNAFAQNIRVLFRSLTTPGQKIVMTGGGALLRSLVESIQRTSGREVIVPENPQATAALGAAIAAKIYHLKSTT